MGGMPAALFCAPAAAALCCPIISHPRLQEQRLGGLHALLQGLAGSMLAQAGSAACPRLHLYWDEGGERLGASACIAAIRCGDQM